MKNSSYLRHSFKLVPSDTPPSYFSISQDLYLGKNIFLQLPHLPSLHIHKKNRNYAKSVIIRNTNCKSFHNVEIKTSKKEKAKNVRQVDESLKWFNFSNLLCKNLAQIKKLRRLFKSTSANKLKKIR